MVNSVPAPDASATTPVMPAPCNAVLIFVTEVATVSVPKRTTLAESFPLVMVNLSPPDIVGGGPPVAKVVDVTLYCVVFRAVPLPTPVVTVVFPAVAAAAPTVNAPAAVNCTSPVVALTDALIPVPLKPLLRSLITVVPLMPLAPPLRVTVRDCALPVLSA